MLKKVKRMNKLDNKKILMGVSGGIAVYKIATLVSQMKQAGADVKVIMTKNAQKFVTPLTFQTLSANPVYTDMFDSVSGIDVNHITLAKWADYFIIAPATANTIGKFASGIADDLLSCTVITVKIPTLIVPAMNTNMYTNVMVQRNIKTLQEFGYHLMIPDTGRLACGTEGLGRMPEPEKIIEYFVENIIS